MAVVLLAPAAAQAQRPQMVDINSTPPGATVRLGGPQGQPLTSRGSSVTPLRRVRVAGGPQVLYFELSGFVPQTVNATIARGANVSANLVQSGSLSVTVNVEGGQILLDNNQVGQGSGVLNNLTPGPHQLEVRREGYLPFQQTVTIASGQTVTVAAQLRPARWIVRAIVQTPDGNTPEELQVSFDGSPMAGTPPQVENPAAGSHVVQVRARGFRPVSREVNVVQGQDVNLSLSLEPLPVTVTTGQLALNVGTAGATVTFDGQPLSGGGPAYNVPNVAVGSHRIVVSMEGRVPYQRDITVAAGANIQIEVPELSRATATPGSVVVTVVPSSAMVLLDGNQQAQGPRAVSENTPAGAHTVTGRAPGFQENSDTCNVQPGQPCAITLRLSEEVQMGMLTMRVDPPVDEGPVTVVLDNQPPRSITGGAPLTLQVPAGNHHVEATSNGYNTLPLDFVVQPGPNPELILRMTPTNAGPSAAQLALRRTAISTFGAQPLYRGDVALDVFGGYGSMPVEARFTAGVLNEQLWGVDVGAGLRTQGYYWEIDVRGRVGARLANGVFGVGAEANLFGGFGFQGQGSFGGGLMGVLSLHGSLAPEMTREQLRMARPSDVANRPGSFAFSARIGFEGMTDGLSGLNVVPGLTPNTPGRFDYSSCNYNGMGCPVRFGDAAAARTDPNYNTLVVVDGGQQLVRGLFGLNLEIGLSRNVNLVVSFDRVLGGQAFRRAYYQYFWFYNDSLTYIRGGLTFKF